MEKTDRILNLLAQHGISDKGNDAGDSTQEMNADNVDGYSYVHDDSQGTYTKSLEEHVNPFGYVFRDGESPKSEQDQAVQSSEASSERATSRPVEGGNDTALPADQHVTDSASDHHSHRNSHSSSPQRRTRTKKSRRTIERSRKKRRMRNLSVERIRDKSQHRQRPQEEQHQRDEIDHTHPNRAHHTNRRQNPKHRSVSRRHCRSSLSVSDSSTAEDSDQYSRNKQRDSKSEDTSVVSEEWRTDDSSEYSVVNPHPHESSPRRQSQRDVAFTTNDKRPPSPRAKQDTPTNLILSSQSELISIHNSQIILNEEGLFKRLEQRIEQKLEALVDKKIDDRITKIRQTMNAELKRLENVMESVEDGTLRQITGMENRLAITEDLVQHPIEMMDSLFGFCGRVHRQEAPFMNARQQARQLHQVKAKEQEVHQSYADASYRRLHDFQRGVFTNGSNSMPDNGEDILHEYAYVHHSEVPKKIGVIPPDVGVVDSEMGALEEDPFAYVHGGENSRRNTDQHRPPSLNIPQQRVNGRGLQSHNVPYVATTPSRPPRPQAQQVQKVLYFSPNTPSTPSTSNYFQYSPEIQQLETTLRSFVRPEKRT